MAGSYNHATNDDGSLRDPLDMASMLDTGGDVYEAIEEMYGMIWWLAQTIISPGIAGLAKGATAKEFVEMAEKKYRTGILLSPTDRPAMY